MIGRARPAGLIAAVAALVLTACGVPLQTAAQPIPADVLPAPLVVPVPSPSAPASAPAPSPERTEQSVPRLRLWFVLDDGLAAVESELAVGAPPELVMQSLAVGPTLEQSMGGLRTIAADPLTGLPLASIAPSQDEATPVPTPPDVTDTFEPILPPVADVTVLLSSAFTALPPQEQVLLLGQVVLSLAGSGERTVGFADEAGTPVAVPLPDGRLLDLPATARDYASLIVQP